MFHSIFSSSSSSNTRSSMEFSFGLPASGSASSPFSFGSSSGPVFSITSAGATAPPASNPAPVFGLPSPAVGFGSTLANDQMNDVNMIEDTDQSVSALAQTFAAFQLGSHQIPVSPQNPSPSTFGQPATPPPPSQPFGFGSPAVQPGVNMTEDTNQSVSALAQTFAAFQLRSQQNPVSPQNPSPSTFGQPATPPPPSQPFGFGSPAIQRGVNMTEDTDQSASALAQTFAAFQLGSHQIPVSPQNPSPSTFGQPANPPPPSQPFGFGSPAIQPGVLPLPAFQFVNHQNPSPFQSAGNVEFTGGSFSLGCEGGGDKSAIRFVRLRRHKHRR